MDPPPQHSPRRLAGLAVWAVVATSSASSGPAASAAGRPPTEQARRVAVATVLAACRSGRIDLAEAENLLSRVYEARTAGDLHRATVGLPHPPAPLVVPGDL